MVLPSGRQKDDPPDTGVKRLRQYALTLQVCRRAGVDHNAEIHFSLTNTLQHPLLGPVVQHKIYIGITTITVSYTLRDQVGRNRLAGGDLNGPAQLLSYPPGVAQRHRQFIKQTLQPARQLLARFGKHHFAGGTIEQTNAGLMLQLFNAVADSRLAQANHLPCPAEAFSPGDGDEHF